mgnify:CR=1 FL=1
MVAINPFSYEQVAIIFLFLSVMVGVLLFVRLNRGKLKLQPEKTITILEDTAISQTERLRLIKVGDEAFLMSTVKGQSPQLIRLNAENTAAKHAEKQRSENLRTSKSVRIRSPFGNRAERSSEDNAKSQSSGKTKTTQTESIFDAIKQARNKNPLLGLDK